ncbi:MAG: DUF262 domain-containing protein [Polyangiaceae bacterium]|nr:DUF262 domain-containing protein [Polyangiaceae bacterium]
MTVRAPGFLSEPKIQFLTAVLEELRKGMLEVPRFQRPFVWNDEKQLELLRSVRDGLPVGSLMIWETRRAVAASEWLGERRLPSSTEPVHRYLLDGQQRMATLYAALVPVAEHEAPPPRMAYIDLENDDFILCAPGEVEPRYLALSLLLDSIKLRRAQRTFPDEVAEAWIERSDAVAAAFKDYKLAIVVITTDELDTAIRTFERVNSQGTQMSRVHMIHALSWSEGFHLLDEMEKLRQELLAELGWDEIDDERILDVCRLRLGLPLDGKLGDKLAAELRRQPSVLRAAIEDITVAARFLVDKCNVRSPRLLPFRQQLLVLAVALRAAPTPPPDVEGRLIAWFWVSTLTGWFAGEGVAARRRLLESLDEIVDIGKGLRKHPFGARERQPLGPTFDIRTARGRALVLLLASLRPRLPSGEEVALDPLLGGDPVEVAWMIPRDHLATDHGSPGNRFLLPVRRVAELRRCLADAAGHPWAAIERIAGSHAIHENARALLVCGDERGFVAARRAALDDLEERALRSHRDALG